MSERLLGYLLMSLLAVSAGWLAATVGSSGTWALLVAGVTAGWVFFVVKRPSVESIGFVLLASGVATASWDAVNPRGLPLADVLLAMALVTAMIQLLGGRRLPIPQAWLYLPGLLIVFTFVILVLHPPPPEVFADRYHPPNNAAQLNGSSGYNTNVDNSVKFLLALVAVPWLLMTFGLGRARLSRLADAWCAGVCVNAVLAVLDEQGVTSVSAHLIGFVDVSGRQPGLTTHPNQLALAIVLTLPVAVSWGARRGTWQLMSAFAVGSLILAVLVTGSRAGIAAAFLAVGLTVAAQPALRRFVLWMTVPGSIVIAVNSERILSFLGSALTESRFGEGHSVSSDLDRLHRLEQARRDFDSSPFYGIGMRVALEGHNVYLQVLAAAGIIGLAALTIYALGALYAALSLWHDMFARVMGVSIFLFFLLGVVSNNLVARYLFVPVGIIAGLSRLAEVKRSGAHEASLADVTQDSNSTVVGDRQVVGRVGTRGQLSPT